MAIALLKRFPRLHPPDSYPVIPAECPAQYAELAADFAVLNQVVTPAFVQYDTAALRAQHRYRVQQLVILLGSAVVTGLGGLQAVFSHQRWPGLVLAVLGVLLAGSARLAGEQSLQDEYLSDRIRAERLRGLYFQYLSRTGPYSAGNRQAVLQHAVLDVSRNKEPA